MTEPILELEFEKLERLEKHYNQIIAEKEEEKRKALSLKDAQIAELQKQLEALKKQKP